MFFNKSFFNKSLNIITGYHAGNGFGGEKDDDNSGAVLITASLYPMLNCDNSLKTLSLNVAINAQTKDTVRSTYHALLGYKYTDVFTGSLEYLGAYGGTSSLNMKALGAFLSYTVYNPYAVFVRFDYSNDAGFEENYILSGVSTKMFNDTFGLALTYALSDPCGAPATAKVFALNSVYSF